MLRNKKFSIITLGLYTASMLALPLSASAATGTGGAQAPAAKPKAKVTTVAPHSTYEQCLTNVSKIDDLSILKNRINTRADHQLAILNKAKPMLTAMAPDQQSVLSAGIASDIAVFNKAKADSANVTDVKVLWTNYCTMYYTTFVSKFRVPQIAYTNMLNKRLKRDTALQTVLASPYDTTYKGLLKDVVNAHYTEAKQVADANVAAEKAAIAQLLAAKVDVTAHQPTLDLSKSSPFVAALKSFDSNYTSAYTKWTEAGAIRAAAKKVQPDLAVGTATVALQDADGKDAPTAKKAVKATVTVNVNSKATNVLVARKGANFLWR